MRVLIALLLTPCAALAQVPAPTAEATTLHCGRVFDSTDAKLLGEHTLVVREGRIESVRKGAPAAGEQAIDLSAHTCLPGWIDSHTHLTTRTGPQSYSEGFRLNDADVALRAAADARTTLLAGFTAVRDLGDRNGISIALRNAISEGSVIGPRVYSAGKSIATTGGHADPSNGVRRDLMNDPGPREGVVNSAEDARKAVRQRYKEGSDLIKITATGGVLSYAKSGDNPQFTIEEVRAIVEAAKDYGYKVAAHAHGKEGMRRAIIGGVHSIEHGTYMDEELFALMRKHGTIYVPTITAGEFVSEMAKDPNYYPPIVRPKAARIGQQIKRTFAAAYKAGVAFAFGTDAGVYVHGDNAREFELLVDAGVPANIALQSANRHAAELLGEWAELGSIEAGKRADIIALPGDPVADISLVHKVEFVMKDGVVHKRP